MNLSLLGEPFAADEIDWRIGQCGLKRDGSVWAKCLAYIQNRAIMDRLDSVVGHVNWRVSFRTLGGTGSIAPGIIATIGIRSGDLWIEKEDGAESTDIEPFKGALSSAMKRAAVQWGIGRYLYDLEEGWATIVAAELDGARYGKTKDGKVFHWTPPTLPAWALPRANPGKFTEPVAPKATPVVSKATTRPSTPLQDEPPPPSDQDFHGILNRMRTPGAMPTRP